jgi:hypothetical protein
MYASWFWKNKKKAVFGEDIGHGTSDVDQH